MKYEQQPGSGGSAASSKSFDHLFDPRLLPPFCDSQNDRIRLTFWAYFSLSEMNTRHSCLSLISSAELLSFRAPTSITENVRSRDSVSLLLMIGISIVANIWLGSKV